MELAFGLAQAALAWLETLDGGTAAVCAYISTGAEPPTERLLEALVESSRAVYIPVCEPGQHLSWVSWHKGVTVAPSPLAPCRNQWDKDTPSRSLGTFRVFIPALAIDADGVRLGQGGGDYDRFLSSPAGAAPVVTVIFDDELLPLGTLPYDALDVPVRFAVTPTGHCSVGSQLS